MRYILNLSLISILIISFTACEEKEFITGYNLKHENSKISPLFWNGKNIFPYIDQQLEESGRKRAFKEAMELFYEEKYSEAMKYLEYSDYILPSLESSRQACIILQTMKKFEESISWCTQGHELGDDLSLLGIALAYRGVKNYEEALNWAFIANEKQIPGSAGTIGLVYSEIGDYVNAEKWYLQAIKDDPKDSQDLNNLISFYIEDLNDKIRGAAYAIASVNNVFPANTIAKFLVVTHKIPLEDLQKAYEFQLNNPILPYRYEEKGRRIGFLNEKDYKEAFERYKNR